MASANVDRDFLIEVYKILQSSVERFDEKSLTIKTWSVTLSMAGIGAGFLQTNVDLILLAALSAIPFWIIEVLWKSFQQAFYDRIRLIEKYMSDPGQYPNFSSPYIARSWSARWRSTNRIRITFWPHVYLPHAVVFAGGVLAWMLIRFTDWFSL